MLGFFSADVTAARGRADQLDSRITADARAAGGEAYAGLCAISLRQAYGGAELVAGPHGRPWAFLKEISSDGNVSTVDVLYPASPAWLYADPAYLGHLLEPLLAYAEAGGWPRRYAEHDLGSAYPDATGHNDGIEGRIAHSVNLALKGIIAIAAMGQIATAGDHGHYARIARRYMSFWLAHARDPDGRHLDLAYDRDDRDDGTWGTVYNAYADRLLGTGLVPRAIQAEQAAWY
ncbi:MAG: glutaminase domain-containing protein, partial [Streptosporangiaceae bacterium]